jgi:hypothetical protein
VLNSHVMMVTLAIVVTSHQTGPGGASDEGALSECFVAQGSAL